MRRIVTTIVCTCFATLGIGAAALGAAERPPNIVWLVADDLGYGELGCQGRTDVPTPQIDSLAAHGVRCTAAYVTAPFCSASRAGLMTGRYQTRFGYEFNPTGAENARPDIGLSLTETTIAGRLRDAGYATGLVGKWHLGGTAPYHPLRRGFDEFFGFLHEGHYYVPPPYAGVTSFLRRRTLPPGATGRWISADQSLILSTHLPTNEPPYDADNPVLRGSQPVQESAHLTDAFTREAVDFIRRRRDQPFFLYVAYNAVHSPMQADHRYLQRFAHIEDLHRRVFAAMLAHLDDSVGAILDCLRTEGLEHDTLIVFLSDNGGPTRELTSSNAPLRGGKGEMYDGGLRVPLICQWRGTFPEGVVEPRPILSLDLFATAVAAAGAPLAKPDLDGVDLRPYLTGANTGDPHASLYWRVGEQAALRQGDWKIVRPRRRASTDWELYQVSEDISETRNLAAQEPHRLEQLTREWDRLNAEMQPPAWRPGK